MDGRSACPLKFKPFANPLLIVGDNPALPGGLSRIGRDLATLAATLPEFRVGYLGRGEGNNAKLPFTLYSFSEAGQWGQGHLQATWEDFSRGEPGVIMTTDDPSRRLWFACPQAYGPLAAFLGDGRNFSKWGYFPVDGWGPGGRCLGGEGRATVAGYDRVLAASEWGRDALREGGRADADWLPHGLFMDKFHAKPKARAELDWKESDVWVGSVMANHSRKDFPALFECAAVLRAHYGNRFHLWLHTDILIRYWNVYALAADYGVSDCLEVTHGGTDEGLATRYSACDCTLLPSAGEGFSYPTAESLACGTACVVTDYAAGQELVQQDCRVRPVAYRVDTAHNVRRAVISGHAFAQAVMGQVERKKEDWGFVSEGHADSVSHLDWSKLRHLWTRWFREGLR